MLVSFIVSSVSATHEGKQASQQGEPMKAVQNEVSPKRYTNVIHQTG